MMTSTNGLTLSRTTNVQRFLNPISQGRRAGESLRYEGTYDRIQEARREDDQSLSQGIYKERVKRADWQADAAICIEALETRTKDLQIAGWLLEAWLHLRGFAGVEAGLNLLTGLCEHFWDDMYPNLASEDIEDRVAPIEWINQKLAFKLKQIPLTSTTEGNERSYCYADWENACHFENLARKDPRALQEALANIDPTVSSFRAAVLSTDAAFHVDLVEELNGALSACAALQRVLDDKCGKRSPSLHQFTEILSAIHQLMIESLQARHGLLAVVEEEPETTFDMRTDEQEIELWSSGPIRSRADAYRRLAEAAEYLRQTEPHSPTPYLVQRAVEWGDMTLLELFQQIVRNDGAMEEIDRLLQLSGRKVG